MLLELVLEAGIKMLVKLAKLGLYIVKSGHQLELVIITSKIFVH